MSNLLNRLKADAEAVEKALTAYLSRENERYPVLFDAMRYGVLGGGKRVRPFLAIEVCRMLGGKTEDVMPYACALEHIHSYSLVHDDMPCMDNDVLRRGKPTMHVKYGEANALLCGDALLTKAFEIATENENADPKIQSRAVKSIADLSGAFGMIGGQMLDLASEGKNISPEDMRYLHSLKTGALIKCACRLGIIASGCTDEGITADIDEYARCIGITFQIIDDILDKTGDEATFGKSIGSDEKQNKTTYLSFMSVEEAYSEADKLTKKAVAAIEKYENSEVLTEFAAWLYARKK
ncbi:MAG: polyprenyl synthetase family protein [Clostridia bacterium]|nr:polyprenyl synthetase family protein [Clostridia bacterium]